MIQRKSYITNILCVVCLIVTGIQWFSPSIAEMLDLVPASRESFVNGNYLSMITSGFMHADLLHLVTNVLSLYAVGDFLEQRMSKPKYLFVYFGGIICANLGFIMFSTSPVVGASGAIFAVLGGLLAFAMYEKQDNLKSWIFGTLALNIFVAFTSPTIAWEAHLFGFIFGFVVCEIFIQVDKVRA